MAGGLIEGFQKIFKGKNVVQKQIFLISLVLVGLILELVTDGNAILKLIVLPVTIISTITLSLYNLHFLHNSVKFCVYRDREDNIEKVKAIQIMPEINLNIFSHFWCWLGFIIIWSLIWFALGLVLGMLSAIPLLGLIFILVSIIILFCYAFSFPIIYAKFAETYTIKGNLNFGNVFAYIPKIFVPVFFLYLKIILIALPLIFAAKIIYTMAAGNVTINFIGTAILMYITQLIGFACTYEIANIYYNRIKIEEEV